MSAGTAHRSPTVSRLGPEPSYPRLLPSSRNDVLILPHRPLPTQPFSVHASSKPLSLLDFPSRLYPSRQVAPLLDDLTLSAAVPNYEGDPRLPSLMSVSRILVAAMAFGFSCSVMLLLPEISDAASGGRMGGRSFGSSSTSSPGSGSSSSHSSPSRTSSWTSGSSSSHSSPARTSSFYISGGSGSPSTSYSHVSNQKWRWRESEWVASVTPATRLSTPATVHSWASYLNFLVFACVFGVAVISTLPVRDASTILKLQVGLLGSARSLQEDLNRIANISDPSTKYGLHNILTETILSLLRHRDYFSSGFSNVDRLRNIEHCEEKFNCISTEERAKIDEETLVNTVNIKSQSKSRRTSDNLCNEYIVVTILTVAEGKHRLPAINGRENLEEALNKLASISSSKILAVEVLWTPQDLNDRMTEQELMVNYPLLRPL